MTGTITETADAVRPIYNLGRHHGYRQALEDLLLAVEIEEVPYSAGLVRWLEETKRTVEDHHGS